MQFRTRGQKIFNVVNYILVTLVCLSCMLPIVNTLAISFSAPSFVSAGQVYFWPKGFTTQSYEFAMSGGKFLRSFLIAIERCVLGVAINLFCMITTAYPLSKSKDKFPDRNFFMGFYVFTMLFGGGLVPWYILMYNLGLLSVPVSNMAILMNFMRSLPKEMEEAASVDGAGNFRILVSILLPVLTPSLATVGLFAFVYHWNDWLSGALFINNPAKYPLQTYLQTLLTNMRDLLRQSGSDYYTLLQRMNEQTGRASQLFLGLVPILVVYPFVQKYFTTGLVMGSVKG